jgi:bifunctional pyridoxal-dependent enzyme with beta-cystathionase and maltose regulon repressor activities
MSRFKEMFTKANEERGARERSASAQAMLVVADEIHQALVPEPKSFSAQELIHQASIQEAIGMDYTK